MNSLSLLPPTASTYANELNVFFWVMVALCGTVATAIAVFIIYCAVKYRRKHPDELPHQISGNVKLETTWMVVPGFCSSACSAGAPRPISTSSSRRRTQ